MQRSKKPERAPDEHRIVSLAPSDFGEPDTPDEPPISLAALRAWEPEGEYSDRSTAMIPLEWHWAVEITARACEVSMDHISTYALHRGLPLLLALPGIERIRAAREAVQEAAADASWYDAWTYQLEAPAGRKRLYMRHVDPDDAGACTRLARDLGLPAWTVAGLALGALLLHLPPVPQPTRAHMVHVLRDWRRRLRTRAADAWAIAEHTTAHAGTPREWAFTDVLEDES